MARVRYVGSEPVTVPELSMRTVEPDSVVEVPDERFEGYVCQQAWEPVEEPGAKAAGARKTTAAKSLQKDEG